MEEIKAYLKPGLEQVNAFIDAALRSDIPLLDSIRVGKGFVLSAIRARAAAKK